MRYIASCKQRSNSKEMLEHNKIGQKCNSSHPGRIFSAAPAARPRSRPLSVSRVTPIPLSIPGTTSAPPAPLPAPAPGPRPAPASASPAVAGTTATPATSSPETAPIRSRPASIDSDPQVAAIVGPPVELVHGVLGIVLVVKPNKGKASRPASPPFSWQVDIANIAKLLEKRLQVFDDNGVGEVANPQGGHAVHIRGWPSECHPGCTCFFSCRSESSNKSL